MDYATTREFAGLIDTLVAVWVMIDASKRGLSGLATFAWGLGTFLVLCVGLPAWLLVRPAVPGVARTAFKSVRPMKSLEPAFQQSQPGICPACGGEVHLNDTECPSCGIHFVQEPETIPPPA